jgi:hypothetical protein
MSARCIKTAAVTGTLVSCCAVPFEEDDKDPSIWFLDHSYLENMFRMFKKVNGGLQHERKAKRLSFEHVLSSGSVSPACTSAGWFAQQQVPFCLQPDPTCCLHMH